MAPSLCSRSQTTPCAHPALLLSRSLFLHSSQDWPSLPALSNQQELRANVLRHPHSETPRSASQSPTLVAHASPMRAQPVRSAVSAVPQRLPPSSTQGRRF